jgi:malonate decarboxylase beta subunit
VSEATHAKAAGGDLNWFEATARRRVEALVDGGSFEEFIPPRDRQLSPHLPEFDLPRAFDDGMIVGRAKLGGQAVFLAAQEGQFMGGSFGEIHGAKLVGLLRAATRAKTVPVILLLDTGGVRLQEANAGELAIAEVMRAIVDARIAGVKVLVLLGGRAGCFGGGSLIAATASAIAISEQGRLGVSGPEVIETNRGVEEFDSRDRPLVWRTVGGKHRRLMGGADLYVGPTVADFRQAALALIEAAGALTLEALKAEQARLQERLDRFGVCADGRDVWAALGVEHPETIPAMGDDAFAAVVKDHGVQAHDAR